MGYEIREREAEVVTLSLYWELVFPQYPVPAEHWLRGWLKRTELTDVMVLFDQLRTRRFDSAEHLGKVISSMIRQIADGDLVKVFPQDSAN